MLNITNHQGNANQNHNEIAVKKVIIERTTNSRYGPGCGEKETLVHCWWDCKLVQPLATKANNMEMPQKNKNDTPLGPSQSTSGSLFIENKNTNSKRSMHPKFIAALFIIAKI